MSVSGLTSVFAETFVVTVGKDASLLYEPTSVTAKLGDTVEFQFVSKNHTVSQSTFDKPCVAKADGIDSGYQFIPGGTTVFPSWSFTVQNETAPIWFFCAQGAHCKAGMVFAINPNAEKTFEKFHAAALASDPPAASGTAGGAYGGAVGGGLGGGYGGSVPGASTGIPEITAPAANAGSGTLAAAGAGETNLPSGALSRAVGAAGWPVLLASIFMGALAL